MYDIRISPEVIEFLEDIPEVLLREGYKATYDYAVAFVDDIIDFIYQIPSSAHYPISPSSEHYYNRYGNPLYYSLFKRRGNTHTTWYIFFTIHENKLLVTHISNNWNEGQYIR